LDEADEVWRAWPRANVPWYQLGYVRMLALMDDTPTAIVGSDTLICQPMDDVWDDPFDMALTWRPGNPEMPYNMGVTFCRAPGFFAAMAERMEKDKLLRQWMGDQKALAKEAASGKWRINVLHCDEWNNSALNSETIPKARMLHYKGERKQWMAEHFRRGIWR
jgi:hypothetical protein